MALLLNIPSSNLSFQRDYDYYYLSHQSTRRDNVLEGGAKSAILYARLDSNLDYRHTEALANLDSSPEGI